MSVLRFIYDRPT